jgi:dienelactone hydrolase
LAEERAVELPGPGGQALRGILCLPEGSGPFPGLACFHGLTLTHAVFATVAPVLARAGLASLRLNFRGHGDSGGKLDEQGFEDQIADVVAGLRGLGSLPELDPKRLGLLGFSMGGAVCANAAKGLGQAVRALGLWAPLLKTQVWLEKRYETYGAPVNGKVSIWDGVVVNERLFSEGLGRDPLADAISFPGPALFIHGAKDRNHPQSASQEAVASRLVEQRETWCAFPAAAGHHFQDSASRQARDQLTASFFKSSL